jgi:hypothetical protein
MKRYLFILVLLSITIFSGCHHDSKKRHHKKHKNSLSKDTLFITRRSAISVWLDTATLEKRRKQYGDTSFYIAGDDEVYYSGTADSVLTARKLPLISGSEFKFIKFEQNNGIVTIIRTDTLSKLHTLYLFDPSKAPYDADVTIMDEEYKNYYHQGAR